MTFVDAAAIPVQFATAYHCLYETGAIRPSSRVLIHAAAGGVGQAAIQV
jgi:coronafacic acid polyketide synthase Cfa6